MRIIPHDKANHYYYGTIVALLAALVVLVLATLRPGFGSPLLLAAAAAILAASLVGWFKERMDERANERAAAEGRDAPHGVEVRDILYTSYGGIPVAAPLFLVWLLKVAL